jgi:hypothetical protein
MAEHTTTFSRTGKPQERRVSTNKGPNPAAIFAQAEAAAAVEATEGFGGFLSGAQTAELGEGGPVVQTRLLVVPVALAGAWFLGLI